MLGLPHAALALLQFGVAVIAAVVVLAAYGAGVRHVLLANLAVALLLTGLGGAAFLRGSLALNRRLLSAWPVFGVLIVPVWLTGWDIEGASGWRGDVPQALAFTLPFGLLLALQTSLLTPVVSPPASETAPPRRGSQPLTYLVLALVFAVVFVALAIRSLVSPGDDHTAVTVSLLAAAYAFNAIHCALAPALHLAGRGRILPGFAAATAASNLLLNLALVPLFGGIGAATATLLSFAALAAATFGAARRTLRLPVEETRIAKIVASAAIVVLATLRWPAGSSWELVYAHAATALIGFPIVLALSGFFRRHERDAVRRLLWVDERPLRRAQRALRR